MRFITILKNTIGLGNGHERSNRAKRNIAASFIIKGLSILISLILVPMTINYINPTKYGIWITLSSIIGWFSFFDIGFGNGLRNKFAEAVALGNKELARKYVSTTYAILSIIIVVVFFVFIITNPFLNWAKILGAPKEMAQELSSLAFIVFSFFCLQFVLQLITTILIADQKPAKASYFNLLGSVFSLITIFLITKSTKGSLIYLGLALGFSPILVLSVASIWFFTHDYKYYVPSFKYIKFSYAKDLMHLGIKFFILQIAALILYQTNNIIITQLIGPADVTVFNIAYKYFGVIPMAFSIITAPFWSAYTESYLKKDLEWIKRSIRTLMYLWLFTSLLALLMLLVSGYIYKLWIGSRIPIPFSVSIACALYVIIVTWANIFLTFVNGIGKISLQLYLTIIVIVFNIPLAIFLAKYLNMGISGVLFATCIDFLIFAIIIPIQYLKIINNNAVGIWNK